MNLASGRHRGQVFAKNAKRKQEVLLLASPRRLGNRYPVREADWFKYSPEDLRSETWKIPMAFATRE